MPKKHKKNIILLILAILAIIIAYNILLTDKAIAPEASSDSSRAVIQETATSQIELQSIQSNEISADVLMYHHVGPLPQNADNIRKGLTVSTQEFDSQIKYLLEHKYKFLTLGELAQAIEAKKVPGKVVVLTFDDGYNDNFSEAWTVMQKYNVTGTFFLIVNKLGTSEYMSKDQAAQLQSGKNEIGSHSMTHPSLEKLKGLSLEREVKNSKEELEKIISGKVVSFCYPAGKYSEDAMKAVALAGYKMAVTTHSSTGMLNSDQLLEIPRYRISSSMSFEALFR
jgi:peptidoglycan/xylan/chitin deacetylase (PgdA/CDA1 family)